MKVSICYLKYRDHSTYSAVKNPDKVKLTSRLLNTWCCYCCTVLDEIEKRIIHFKKKNHSILKAKPVSRDLYNIEKLFTQLIFKHIFSLFSYISADLGSAKTRNGNFEISKQNLFTQDFQRRLTVNKLTSI